LVQEPKVFVIQERRAREAEYVETVVEGNDDDIVFVGLASF
jgi:hypothetical protein